MIFNKETMKKAFEVDEFWGDKMPMMAMEECGELIQAISKVEREDDYDKKRGLIRYNLMEEMRDVYISLMALQHRYGICIPDMNELIEMKLNRKY